MSSSLGGSSKLPETSRNPNTYSGSRPGRWVKPSVATSRTSFAAALGTAGALPEGVSIPDGRLATFAPLAPKREPIRATAPGRRLPAASRTTPCPPSLRRSRRPSFRLVCFSFISSFLLRPLACLSWPRDNHVLEEYRNRPQIGRLRSRSRNIHPSEAAALGPALAALISTAARVERPEPPEDSSTAGLRGSAAPVASSPVPVLSEDLPEPPGVS